MSYSSSLFQSLAEELRCVVSEVTASVRAKNAETKELKTNLEGFINLNEQLQNQINELSAMMANSIRPFGEVQLQESLLSLPMVS